ncbi:MAG: cytochrome b562 [Enterobacterales bacterium endosymbiont of Blomia tropicalis]|uniref:cytochrome b562 n=1 Tax=Mixta mediterraneensis TaxID=2758443 RepID=UPI0025A88F9C|nr:cytochrome b562 [Mixta mediterraneensis]MDL4915996.1 cytochrome b562 [Mixta mediterraneensis]
MRKHVIAMLSLSLLFTSASLYAADLEQDMDTLNANLKIVKKTDDAREMQKALNEMRSAAQDAKKSTPESLEGQPADSAQMKDFRAGLDSLIAQIDVVNELVKSSNIDGAKAEAKKLDDIRTANHKKFR